MQNLPLGQICHGTLLAVNVTGGQELAAAASDTPTTVALASVVGCATSGHGAIVGAGNGTGSSLPTSRSSNATADENAVRPEPAPVSSTFTSPSNWLVNVNFGQTFRVESNVPPDPMVIDPVEDLKADRPTCIFQFSWVPLA